MRKEIIISLILVLFIFASNLLRAEVDLDLLTPPQGEKILEQEMTINTLPVKVVHYESSISVRDILDYYYNYLSNLGWQVLSDNRKAASLTLSKDKDKITITAFRAEEANKTEVIINYAQWISAACPDCEEEVLNVESKADTPGEDIASVPRYPQTQRILSTKTQFPAGQTVIYKSWDSIEEILDFYRQNMENAGWALQQETSFSDLKDSIKFTGNFKEIDLEGKGFIYTNKDKDLLQLAVSKDPESQDTLIMVKIYEKYYRK